MTPDNIPNILDRVDLPPQAQQPDAAIVWLHGLGADGHDFVPLFQGAEQSLGGVRVLLPHAPERPVTINGGMRMRAWYDIRGEDLTASPDLEGIKESAERIGAVIHELEEAGLPSSRIVLGGFSQGAVMALWTGLGFPRPLAGIAGLSGYLPADPSVHETQQQTPIFMGHGRDDRLIPFSLGEAARDRLGALGCRTPAWHPYPIDHGVNLDEAEDLLGWLVEVLGR